MVQDRRAFYTEVAGHLPSSAIVRDEECLRVYESDGLTAKAQPPWLVLMPERVEQVQAILRASQRFGVPVVARGAGTGLSGGATPHAEGVVLSMARFNRILDVDLDNLTARVQPGVTNLVISEHVAPHGLYYAPDPSSQIACTVGGNVAENSGGVHCLKYGLTVHNILRLEVVTASGELVTIGSRALESPGYDLLALMTGSEGMLGIVVEVVVRLLPQPDSRKLIMAAFADLEQAGRVVARIIASGIIPAGLEMMDRLATRAVEEFVHAGYPTDASALLLCELDGDDIEVDADLHRLTHIFEQSGAFMIRLAADEAERLRLWQGRKSAFPAVGRLAPDYYCMDGTIPRARLASVLQEITALSERFDLAVANVFHAGDGNLHPLILYDANSEDQCHRAEQLGTEILELCVREGGTVTGEHGVGIEKLDPMCLQFTPDEISQFHAVKAAFDPRELLNPGKAVPTLARCREYRLLRQGR